MPWMRITFFAFYFEFFCKFFLVEWNFRLIIIFFMSRSL